MVASVFEFAHAIDVRMGHICAFETITSSKSSITKQYKKPVFHHQLFVIIIINTTTQTKTMMATANKLLYRTILNHASSLNLKFPFFIMRAKSGMHNGFTQCRLLKLY